MCCYDAALFAGLHSGNVGRGGRGWWRGVDTRIFQGREEGGKKEGEKEEKNEGEEEEGEEEKEERGETTRRVKQDTAHKALSTLLT